MPHAASRRVWLRLRRSQAQQRRVEELRRSNAAASHASKKVYTRKRKHKGTGSTP